MTTNFFISGLSRVRPPPLGPWVISPTFPSYYDALQGDVSLCEDIVIQWKTMMTQMGNMTSLWHHDLCTRTKTKATILSSQCCKSFLLLLNSSDGLANSLHKISAYMQKYGCELWLCVKICLPLAVFSMFLHHLAFIPSCLDQ